MNAQPAVIGKRADGTLIGELDGKLYVGTYREVGHDEIEREVEDLGDSFRLSYHVGGNQVGGETISKTVMVDGQEARMKDPPPHTPKKEYEDIRIREPDGSLSKAEIEVKTRVVDWSAL